MPALITELITGPLGLEVVRDKIAAILVEEMTNQVTLADATDGAEPGLWKLRVYVERDAPWEQYLDLPDDESAEAAPIVSVSYESTAPNAAASSVVDGQQQTATYTIDVYGYGVAKETVEGHEPGDMRAALACQRALRLVYRILMSGQYTYLALRGVVAKRWVSGITAFVPQFDKTAAQNIVAVRMTFDVDFKEFSPQVLAETIDALRITVKRDPDGMVLLVTQIGEEDDDS